MNRPRLQQVVGSMNLWIGVGTLGSIGLAVIGTRVGAVPRPGADHWWFNVAGGASLSARFGFWFSAGLFIAGWIGVGWQARKGALTVPRAWVILALWGLPLLLGPPIFSRDIYSYIAQGQLARNGLNPYSVAPSALGNGPLLASIASVWRNTASPYGPIFVLVSRGALSLSDTTVVAQVLAFRLMELVGVAMLMVSLPRLSRRLGVDPGMALWLAALSPLALFSFVASGHNDALMVGLLVAGVTLATEGRLALGLALCALATLIKLPAAAAIVFIALEQLRASSGSRRWRVALETVVVPIGVVVGGTLVAGFGFTWLGPTALRVPTELRVLATPAVSLGVLVHAALHPLGIPLSQSAAVTGARLVCSLLTVCGVIWLLCNAHRIEVVRAIGLTLLLVVVGSPTLWPWYLLWGLALLAATPAQRSKVLAAVAGLAMLVVGPGGTPMLSGLAYVVVVAGLLAGAVWLWRGQRWRTVVMGRAA